GYVKDHVVNTRIGSIPNSVGDVDDLFILQVMAWDSNLGSWIYEVNLSNSHAIGIQSDCGFSGFCVWILINVNKTVLRASCHIIYKRLVVNCIPTNTAFPVRCQTIPRYI